jgi:squalene synthase HpnC
MTIPHFTDQLAQLGPDLGTLPRCTLAEARRYCQDLARTHYENFTVVSRLFPSRLRPAMHALYAYCRWADDLADEVDSPTRSLELLAWWREQLTSVHEAAKEPDFLSQISELGERRHPVMIALGATMREYSLPLEPLTDLISAFEQDQRQNRYDTWMELRDYCRRSANPVGRLILRLAEADTRENLTFSDAICTGLQLANFCQDVARDFRRGRIYLPQEAWRAHGCEESMFARCPAPPAFRSLLEDAVTRAENHFREGLPLLGQVPRWLRTDLSLFVRGGLAILGKIRKIDYDVLSRRPTLGRGEKARLVLAVAILGPRWGLKPC